MSLGLQSDSMQERLRSHAQAFDGLLSLIPAKYYYGDDNTVRAPLALSAPLASSLFLCYLDLPHGFKKLV